MELEFMGAAQIVTGSCYLFTAGKKKVLLECGMFQGTEEITALNQKRFTFDPKEVDFLILSHAHIDHSGLIPRLVQEGFKGKIISTPITKELCKIMLEDSAYVQVKNTETLNKKRMREGLEPLTPIYTVLDSKRAMERFKTLSYGSLMVLNDNFSVRFADAGHILGSAIVELFITENDRVIKVVFSGDLGQRNALLVEDPEQIESADYVLVESTYGDRLHPTQEQRKKELGRLILDNYKKEGKIFIPSFALERTQEILYTMSELVSEGLKSEIETYLDSPLAIRATKIFEKYIPQMDIAARSKVKPFRFKGLHFSLKKEDSVKINDLERPIVVIAGSGMCTGGRILHHLKNGIFNPDNTVLFVGYQAEGTLGRQILDGAKSISIFGESIVVKANIHAIESFSAHADWKDLLWWLEGFKSPLKKVFIVHGEKSVQENFEQKLKAINLNTHIPKMHEKVVL